MRLAFCAVEACRAIRQIDIVNRDEERCRSALLIIPNELEILRTTKRHLRQELFHLWTELRHLVRELPVHEGAGAFCLLKLFDSDLAGNVLFDRATGRQQLFANAGREVHTGFGEHWMHHLACALEIRAAGRVIAKAGAAQAFFILLVAQRAGFLVTLNELKEL